MTSRADELTTEEKIVVFFDICSSSTILEDLLQTDSMSRYRNLMISIKDFLLKRREEDGFIIYKFIGDGWVLLFPPNVLGTVLVGCLSELSHHFSTVFNKTIGPVLQNRPKLVGLTFGVDRGRLIRIVMNEQDEYIGRALNVASRLQGAIKDKDKNPAYKVLVTRPAYDAMKIAASTCKIEKVTRSLRNIRNGERTRFVKLILPVAMQRQR